MMTLKSGTGQACAACKYQRRRCTPKCLLAPFFPADQPKMFRNVHRLFGVKNIQNLLKDLSPDHKAMAMAIKSIKFHANMRDKYPVLGCLVEIRHLTYQIQMVEEELQAVLHQIAYFRQQSQTAAGTDDYLSELQLGMAPPGNGTNLSVIQEDHSNNPPQYNGAMMTNAALADYGMNCLDFKENNVVNSLAIGINYLDFKDNNDVDSLCRQTYSNSNDDNTNSTEMRLPPQMILPVHQETTGHDYNEIQTFSDNIDDTQSYIGSKEAYESSLESPLKDPRQLVEQMDENELKSAAACFSLTSVN
ncbi:LOB domain-containing protein 27-like [Andrographis paniculata]|uniref:LOB domain-containing protein 27-like n=1 Tax=Andrographis paniculata TaxID=175694 RepID=UPI0021E8DB92|nr:LOB domain-containing protein 27-like [Andrographis paniculata]